MCGSCQRRAETNPLRVLDCKVPEDQPIIDALPSIQDHLCEECREHFALLRRALDSREIGYTITPRMVRGLDYYTRTTFEIVHGALGAQNSVLGGGRYDGLAEQLGSKVRAPGIGFSIGEDRLVMIVEELQPDVQGAPLDLFLAPMGEAAALHAGVLAGELRTHGASVETAPGGKLKKLLDTANKLGARYTIIIGEDEIAAGRYALKEMASGEQTDLTREQLIERFSSHV